MTAELHLIGNAHIDPVWIWDWREGVGEIWSTFRSALDRLGEYPESLFTFSSAAHFAWIARADASMFAEIRAAVASGRFCLVGGMWVEPDCNIPSGESICRQLLLGQRFFVEAFGRQAGVGYNVDSFGHAAGFPQLLARSGLDAYVMMRPNATEKDLPGQVFSWQDASGASVVTYRIPFDYGTDSAGDIGIRLSQVADLAEGEGRPMMVFYGVGNHGGGPTRAMLDEIERLRRSGAPIRYSNPSTYFAELGAKGDTLPVVRTELQHHAPGCYSVSAWVKASNRRSEAALLDAETLTAISSHLNGYPDSSEQSSAKLRSAWEELAFCQFHDILAGTSSQAAYKGVRSRFGYVETVADSATTNGIFDLSHRVDTRSHKIPATERHSLWSDEEEAFPFLVYNPLGWPVRALVKVPRSAGSVFDASGRELVSQAVASGEVTVFPSHTLISLELDALGYEVIWLSGGRWRRPEAIVATATEIESGSVKVTVDGASGAVSIRDLTSSRDLTGPRGMRFVVISDDSDTWSHGVARYEGVEETLGFDGCELVEAGPFRSSLRLRFHYGESRVVTDISLAAGEQFVHLRIRADWSTPHVALKLVIPWALGQGATTVAGAAYSHQERGATGDEEPMQGWLDYHDPQTDSGIGITTDHLYSYDASDQAVRVTILRNPLAADHGGRWATFPGDDYPYTDCGSHDATIRIHPHEGDWRSARLPALADEHVRQPLVVADTCHDGELAQRGSFLSVHPATSVVRAVKRSETNDGVVLRLVDPSGEATRLSLSGTLLGRSVSETLRPYEVKTLLVPDDPKAPAREVAITELDRA